jgi:microtubule-associated protein-like 6
VAQEAGRHPFGGGNPGEDGDDEDEQDSVADAQAVKPWIRSINAPTAAPEQSLLQPKMELQLEWIHGYTGEGSRSNAAYSASGEIVYPAAAAVIILNKDTNVQRHLLHACAVQSLAMHPRGKLVASGQAGVSDAIVTVWEISTGSIVRILKGIHRRGVSALAFSSDGNFIVSAGLDDNHIVCVTEWMSGRVQRTIVGGDAKVLCLAMSPNGSVLAQAGIGHVVFHEFFDETEGGYKGDGCNVVSKKGIVGGRAGQGMVQDMLSIGWVRGLPVVGTADGALYQFSSGAAGTERMIETLVHAHDGAVNTIFTDVTTGTLVTGARDGKVKLWSQSLENLKSFDISEFNISARPSVRSVFYSSFLNKSIVGTRGCELIEISASDGAELNGGRSVIETHMRGQLWALSTHPTRGEYVTLGDDGALRKWSVTQKQVSQATKLECGGRAIAYSPDASKIAVGLGVDISGGYGRHRKTGAFLVLDADSFVVMHEAKDAKAWITEVKWSPDGNTLAVGSYDNCVYLYDVAMAYTLKAVFDKHNSFIKHIDFSQDSQYFQSNCGAYELLFGDAANGALVPAASTLKDVEWTSQNCVLGWPVQGFWPPRGHKASSVTDITSVDRTAAKDMLVASDGQGRVLLTTLPCLDFESSAVKSYAAHSNSVAKVRWSIGDRYAISVGKIGRAHV